MRKNDDGLSAMIPPPYNKEPDDDQNNESADLYHESNGDVDDDIMVEDKKTSKPSGNKLMKKIYIGMGIAIAVCCLAMVTLFFLSSSQPQTALTLVTPPPDKPLVGETSSAAGHRPLDHPIQQDAEGFVKMATPAIRETKTGSPIKTTNNAPPAETDSHSQLLQEFAQNLGKQIITEIRNANTALNDQEIDQQQQMISRLENKIAELEKKNRSLSKKNNRLQRLYSKTKKQSKPNNRSVTQDWKIVGMGTDSVLMIPKKDDPIVQLRLGESYEGITIKSIDPQNGLVITSAGNLYSKIQ